MNSETVIICCPPYPKYPTGPEDQPNSELFDCPKCKNKMWLSGKKRGLIMFSACAMKDIILACYDCFTKMVAEDPSILMTGEEMKL